MSKTTSRREFLAISLGLVLMPSIVRAQPKDIDEKTLQKIAEICQGYSQLDGEDKQETFDFINRLSVKRKNEGRTKEAGLLAYFADSLREVYG